MMILESLTRNTCTPDICHNRRCCTFPASIPFSTENAEGTVFSKVYSKNIIHEIPYTPYLIQNVTNTAAKKNKYINKLSSKTTKIPSMPTKIPSTPTKTPSTTTKIYAVLPRGNFCRKFTHFFG